MKTSLSIEQSQRLIELGMNPYLASNEVTEKHPITENEITYQIFTLADLLGILPKEITIDGIALSLTIAIEWLHTEWCTYYIEGRYPAKPFYAPELIDALYKLTIWLIENKHIQQ